MQMLKYAIAGMLALGSPGGQAFAQPAEPAAQKAPESHLVVFNRLGPNFAKLKELRNEAIAHRDLYLRLAAEGKIIAGGAMTGQPVLGLSIFASDVDRDQIRSMIENDPGVKAGIVEIEFREWQLQMGSLKK